MLHAEFDTNDIANEKLENSVEIRSDPNTHVRPYVVSSSKELRLCGKCTDMPTMCFTWYCCSCLIRYIDQIINSLDVNSLLFAVDFGLNVCCKSYDDVASIKIMSSKRLKCSPCRMNLHVKIKRATTSNRPTTGQWNSFVLIFKVFYYLRKNVLF